MNEDYDFLISDIEAMLVEELDPHGDRYLVEKLTVNYDRIIDIGNGDTRTLRAAMQTEEEREQANGYYFAKIIAKGSGHRLEADVVVPMPHEPGEVVMVEKFSGRVMRLGLKSYAIINQVDVLMRAPRLTRILAQNRALAAIRA